MRAYQDMVYGTAFRLLGNDAEAQDICQEVFMKAHARFDEIHASPTVAGWLKTVARNLSLNHLTRHRARMTSFTDLKRDGDEEWDPLASLPSPDTESDKWDAEARSQWVETGLSRLPDTQRVPLVMYHFEELSYEEIAERLGVSLSKIKTDIHRGRQSLRRHLVRAGIHLGDPTPEN